MSFFRCASRVSRCFGWPVAVCPGPGQPFFTGALWEKIMFAKLLGFFRAVAAFFAGLGSDVVALFEEVSQSETPRETLLLRIGERYDTKILPLDLPGPDSIIDPILRRKALDVAGELYDLIVARIAAGEPKADVLAAVAADGLRMEA
jgi:hypothetical protein